MELLDFLLTESNAPVTWLAVLSRDDDPEAAMNTLRAAEPLIKRKGIPQASCRPLVGQIDLRIPFIFAAMRSWKPAFNQPVEVQKNLYRSAEFRAAFRADLARPRLVFSGRWDTIEVHEVSSPALKHLEKRTVAEIAQERGQDGLDTFLDIALEDDLKTQYIVPLFNSNEGRGSPSPSD